MENLESLSMTCCQLMGAAVEQCVFQKQFETVLLLRILKSIETRS
jgi:hypothetical protein